MMFIIQKEIRRHHRNRQLVNRHLQKIIQEIIARIKAQRFSRQNVYVVATGGYADLIAKGLGEIDSVHANLTLEGLRILANLNS